METEVPPREMGNGVVENWAVAAARLEPKTVMSAPGAMAGRKLAALRMPSELVVGVGRTMVKARALDGPPSLSTVTVAVPLAAMRAAGTLAVNWEALTNLVMRGAPFHCTVEVVPNPAPARVRVKAVPPGAAELGLRLARDAAAVGEI